LPVYCRYSMFVKYFFQRRYDHATWQQVLAARVAPRKPLPRCIVWEPTEIFYADLIQKRADGVLGFLFFRRSKEKIALPLKLAITNLAPHIGAEGLFRYPASWLSYSSSLHMTSFMSAFFLSLKLSIANLATCTWSRGVSFCFRYQES
jgi:hypothetical protein